MPSRSTSYYPCRRKNNSTREEWSSFLLTGKLPGGRATAPLRKVDMSALPLRIRLHFVAKDAKDWLANVLDAISFRIRSY